MTTGLKKSATRAAIICLALVMALGTMGVGYAQMNGGAQNNGVVLADGSGFTWTVSNDDGAEEPAGDYDPIDPGDDGGGTAFDGWGTESSDDPSEHQEMGEPCARYDKDVARTTAAVDTDGKGITVVLENAYPCYHPTVFFGIRGPDWGPTSINSIEIENEYPDELTITTSGIYVGQPIPAGEEIAGAAQVHVDQPAEQNATYTFRIIITYGEKPGISLAKQASPTSVTQAGAIVTYTYTVTNTGNVPLEDVTVTENDIDFTGTGGLPVPVFVSSTEGSPEGKLKQGESATYTAQYTVTEADIGAGSIFNRATATGYFDGTPYSDDDTAIVTTNTPNNPSCPIGGCVRLLTVDWDENISTTCLDPYDRCSEDFYAPNPDGKHSLLLEKRTQAPEVDGLRHYLIVIRELEQKDTPPPPENTVVAAAFNITPIGAIFDRDIFLTLGIDELPDDATDATIAYYDAVNGVWVPLYNEPGEPNGVAEITLTAALDHFTIFALLVDLDPAATRFVASDLHIEPVVNKIWEPVTFLTRVGQSVSISANIANQGRWAGDYTAVLKLNGETVASEMVRLGAGQNRQVSFTMAGLDYGQYQVEIAGLSGEFATSRTIAWWLIIVIIAAIGLISWGVARDRRRRKARKTS